MQGPDQGFSPSTPDSTLEAMKSAHSTAVSSNERIFPIFARKLASRDTKEFVNTARKLATWLGSEKAYYAVARPKIVELLEIALSAFMDTFVHHSDGAELGEYVRQLVQTVTPFIDLFPEVDLQSRLQRVILIVDTELSLSKMPASTTQGHVPSEGSVTANIPSFTLASPVHPQPVVPPVPNPPGSMPQIEPSSAPGPVKVEPDASVHEDTPRAYNPSEVASGQTDVNLSPASLVTIIPQECGESISSSIPSKPQPKRARRAELPEELIARDLDWFKSNQALATMDVDPGASSSKASESSPVLASDTAPISGSSPSPKKKTARMVPSRRLPRRISLDTSQEVKSGVSASVLPPASEPLAEKARPFDNVSVQNVHEQKPSLGRMEFDTRSVVMPEVHDMQGVSPREELPSPKPQLVVTSSNEPPFEPEIPQTDYQPSLVAAPLLNGDSAISVHPPVPFPETTSDGTESMDMSTSDLGLDHLLSESSSKPHLTPQSPPTLQLLIPILPPLVNSLEPPLNLNFRISPGELQQSGMDASQRRFDDEMSVIHNTQGKPFTHTHTIDISLNESISAKISKWVNRRFHPSEASHGICISLACYRLPEFFDTIKSGSGKHNIEELTSQSSCSWPSSNRLSLHVDDGTRQTVITLSPPLFLTPDQCVDISSLMKPGDNTLEIRQQGDLSEYLVVLHAHLPTRAQLAEFDAVKTVDERWKRFLDALSARAPVPGKMLSPSPAGVVGVF